MMSLRAVAIAAALLGLFGGMGAVYAQTETERVKAQANPADKLFRLVAPDGTVIAADGQTRRFYIRNRFGGTAEVTFDQVLAKAEPDPVKRAKLKAAFEAALADPRLTNYSYVDKPKINSGPPPCQPSPRVVPCRN